MVGAPWYISNEQLHRDLHIETVKQVVHRLAISYERRLHRHTNIEAIQLLNAPLVTRLKRKTPTDI